MKLTRLDRIAIALALILVGVLLTGCGSRQTEPMPMVSPAPIIRVDSGCQWTRPIVLNDGDLLTPRTARTIVRYNSERVNRCANK